MNKQGKFYVIVTLFCLISVSVGIIVTFFYHHCLGRYIVIGIGTGYVVFNLIFFSFNHYRKPEIREYF